MTREQGIRRVRTYGRAALVATAALIGMAPLATATAQITETESAATVSTAPQTTLLNQTHAFDIPAGSLDVALTRFSEQSGVQLVYEPHSAAGITVPAVQGTYNSAEVLRTLITAAGLTWLPVNDSTVALRRGDGAQVDPTDAGEAAAAPEAGTPGESTTSSVEMAKRGGIEEIIVTGQKREERIQDVPIAISAFSMEDLDNQKIEGGFDLLRGVPNVTFSKTNFSGYNFQIRGIGTQAISATTDPGVAVSFNNTTLIVNRLFEQEYLDIERVEVLRGPQGTLYGRNATSGVVNVISNKPKLNEFEAEIKGELGNYNAQRLRGHVNIPLINDTLAARVAYAMTQRDGYGNNLAFGDDPNANVSEDVDGRDLWTGRLSLGWQANDRLNFNLIWERFNENDNRVRTSKQLCHRDPSATSVGGVDYQEGYDSISRAQLSQGCRGGSLYDAGAYGTPNGESLPYVSGLWFAQSLSDFSGFVGGGQFAGWAIGPSPWTNPGAEAYHGFVSYWTGQREDPASAPCPAIATPEDDLFDGRQRLYSFNLCQPDPYGGRMQSTDLREIYSLIEPEYRAKADLIELSFDFEWNDNLKLTSQTVYAKDDYYATQDYNRYATLPIWNGTGARSACGIGNEELFPGFVDYFVDCSMNPDSGRGTFMPLTDADGDGAIDQGSFGSVTDAGYTVDGDGYVRNGDGRRVGYYNHLLNNGGDNLYCDPQLGCSDKLIVQDISSSKSTQWNQEVRLVSSYDGPWNFSLGANYTRFQTQNDYYVISNAFSQLFHFWPFQNPESGCPVGSTEGQYCRYIDPNPLASINGEGHNYFRSSNPYELTSSALFGELYWNVTEALKVTAGARMSWDQKVFTPVPSQLLLADYRDLPFISEGDPPPTPDVCTINAPWCGFTGSAVNGRGAPALPDIIQSWREPTGRLVVDWKPELGWSWLDETLVYGSISRGYKGGGANPPTVSPPSGLILASASGGAAPPLFKPEYVNAYEIGTKNKLFGGGMTLNLGAFYYNYKDYQVSKIVDRTAVNENFDATVWGLELESVIAPTPDLLLNASIGYLRTRIGDDEESIDLMDRTQGGNRSFTGENGFTYDEWEVVKPWVVAASNCVVPAEILAADLASYIQTGNRLGEVYFCPVGGILGRPVDEGRPIPYFDDNGALVLRDAPNHDGRTYNPYRDAPNSAAGFSADLSGNELPNAPRFTVSLGGQYTFYLPGGWDLTGRVDWYWQDKSFARVYNTEYDQLRAWDNTNFSFWVNQTDWDLRVEVYVKNAFDESPITGTFLNSDDSGLTTNVFTLDPRLVGLSITKRF